MDPEVQGLHSQTSNLKTLLEAEADMKKVAKAKNADLTKKLESLRTQLSDLQVNNNQLSQQVFIDVVSAGIAKGMSRGLKHGVEYGKANLDLEAIEAYDPEADTKYVTALRALRDLKYHMVDQLENLKYAPIDVVMASLHLESDSREDAPQWIRELRPSSSQLKIPVYPKVRGPKDPWSFKEEILLEAAIAANCLPFAPQGLAILLADAATQTETSEDEASPRLLRSKSLPPMYNLDWP
ncbi:hypothetical protein Tco_0647807 [Tanacetum coccineum]